MGHWCSRYRSSPKKVPLLLQHHIQPGVFLQIPHLWPFFLLLEAYLAYLSQLSPLFKFKKIWKSEKKMRNMGGHPPLDPKKKEKKKKKSQKRGAPPPQTPKKKKKKKKKS